MNEFFHFSWLIIGPAMGVLAWLILPERKTKKLLITVLVGLLGAFLGTLLSGLVFADPEAPFSPLSMAIEFLGAVVLLGLYLTIKLPKHRPRTPPDAS